MASGIGKPLFTDKITAKLDPMPFARICVEMHVTSKFSETLSVAVMNENSEELTFEEVRLEYQNRPTSCPSCLTFGHSKLKCTKANYQWVPKSLPPSAIPGAKASVDNSDLQPPATVSLSPAKNVAQNLEWTEVSKGPKNAKDKGKSALTPTTATSNTFQAIRDIEPSDIDLTPKPNPLVS